MREPSPVRPHGEDIEASIEAVLADTVRRRNAGESLPDPVVLAAHPDLAPELAQRLRTLSAFGESTSRSSVSPDASDDGAELDPTVTPKPAFRARIPQHIGAFHIKRVLASGGMGVVYEATQENPRRVVAIKLMKHGVTSRSALRRFEYEAQVLARLRHPGIAQVYEAGTHDDGAGPVPYFAMEYIPNAHPITEFVKLKKLGIRRRLELFAHACDAVHHGHQKGIIHRDLKPANVLVDSHGEVKIIDFGVARGTDSDLAVTTLQTDIGQLIGTLQYMSPEQCDADPHDLDIRSDVYALGVVLYELLSGKLPYEVSRRTLAESTRAIREQAPTKMSATDPSLRGDIETVVFKALEKERDRRYQSASELAQDIRRYLAGEAIVARPPSLAYQFKIFVHRNKALVASLAGIFVALLVGLAASTVLYMRAQRERDRAVVAEAKATAINEFLLEDLLTSSDPEKAKGREITVRNALDAAAARVTRAFSTQPALGASIRKTIGRTYLNLGLYDEAEPHLSAASAVLSGLLGEDHPDTLDARYWHGMLLVYQPRYAEAESLLRTTLAAQRRVLGVEHADTLRTQIGLAATLSNAGRKEEGFTLMRESLAASRRSLGEEHPQTLRCAGNLASSLGASGASGECDTLAAQTVRIAARVLGEDHPETLRYKWIRSDCDYQSAGAAQKAPVTAEMVEEAARVLGEGHPQTLARASVLALTLLNQGKLDEAERVAQVALERSRRLRGGEARETVDLMDALASVYDGQGRFAEAEELARQALGISRRVRGDEDSLTLQVMTNLGGALGNQGKYAEAEELYRKTLESSRRVLGEEHTTTILLMTNLGAALSDQGKYAEAEELTERVLTIARRTLQSDSPLMRNILNLRAMALNSNGRPEEAEPFARQAYEAERKASGETGRDTLAVEDTLANSLYGQGKLLEAEPMFASIVTTVARLYPGEALVRGGELWMGYGRCLSALGKFEAAEAELLAAHQVFHPNKFPRHRVTRETLEALVDLYTRWGKEESARAYKQQLEKLLADRPVSPADATPKVKSAEVKVPP